ncbi:chaperonin 10-like protein [Kalaharituber pfeilii]|nr:chaperonin 10-like protein [Kalaharituber pfeilii]
MPTESKGTMKAVVFHGPYKIAVEERPMPDIVDDTDAIVKVTYTALCGSELHVFRGHQPSDTGFIMGHEFTGHIIKIGSAVQNFTIGDKVVSPFTTSCGNCFYCKLGYTSRCEKGLLFGCSKLDGGQAEYVRVPLADGTLLKTPEGIPEETVVLMADIFPTGYFAASNAFQHIPSLLHPTATIALIGCGPVGLCALISALSFRPKKIFAIDCVPSRLSIARSLGAEPLNFAALTPEALRAHVLEATDGRGVDAVMEVVGNAGALRTAYELIRPFGMISSVGVHNGEIPISGAEMFAKNVRVQFGRCPVRAMFPKSLELLKEKHGLLGFMADKIMPLTEAEEGYELFDKMMVQKVIFNVDK